LRNEGDMISMYVRQSTNAVFDELVQKQLRVTRKYGKKSKKNQKRVVIES